MALYTGRDDRGPGVAHRKPHDGRPDRRAFRLTPYCPADFGSCTARTNPSDPMQRDAPQRYHFSMATTAVTIQEYLSTTYEPDCDYVDGEIQERNLGTFDHSRLQLAIGAYFYI